MFQQLKAVLIVSIMTGAAFAGQIEIGGANGLTGAYLTGGSACTGATVVQAGFSGCVTPTTTAAQRSYSAYLWSGSVPAAAGPSGETAGLQLTDTHNGINYSMVNNGSTADCAAPGDGGCNFWSISNNQTMTIPVGVLGATLAHIMLNDYWGAVGGQNTTVILDFAATSNGSATTSLVFALVNGTDIRSATECTGGGTSAPSTTCPSYAYTASSAANTNVFTTTYTDNTGAQIYGHTKGTLALDAIAFSIPLIDQSLWLTDIRITNVSAPTGTGSNVSRTALTAISLETAGSVTPVPEPTTAFLIFGGVGLLGYYRRRNQSRRSVV